jgi:predicted permease
MRNIIMIVVAIVLLLGVSILLTWLGSRRRLRVAQSGGVAVLRLAVGRNAVLLPALLFAAMPFAMRERGAAGIALPTAAALVAVAVAAYFFVGEVRKRVRVGDAGIERIGVFTRRRLAWGDVEKIAYNPTSKSFFLVGSDGTRLWIYESFEGVGDFAEMALRNLPPTVLTAVPYVREELEELAAT